MLLKQKCRDFGKRFIGWDGCMTIPVLIVLIAVFIAIMGLKFFSIFFVVMLVMEGAQMYFDRVKNRRDQI